MRTPEIGRRTILFVFASFLLAIAIFYVSRGSRTVPDTLPARLSNEEFWRMVTEFSEAGGYFRSDNFLSNERAFQRVLPELANGAMVFLFAPEASLLASAEGA